MDGFEKFIRNDAAKAIAEIETKAEMKQKQVFKVDDALGIVFGFGLICSKVENGQVVKFYDSDNQYISEQTMLKATAEFMESERINNNDHTPGDTADVGVVVFSFPLTQDIAKSMGIQSDFYGWMVGVKPDAETLTKFQTGEYTGFSIEGGCTYVDEQEL